MHRRPTPLALLALALIGCGGDPGPGATVSSARPREEAPPPAPSDESEWPEELRDICACQASSDGSPNGAVLSVEEGRAVLAATELYCQSVDLPTTVALEQRLRACMDEVGTGSVRVCLPAEEGSYCAIGMRALRHEGRTFVSVVTDLQIPDYSVTVVELRGGTAERYYGPAAPYVDTAYCEHMEGDEAPDEEARSVASTTMQREYASLPENVRTFLCYGAEHALSGYE
ncbi:MAG: hypothetical protein R3B82_09635 [Sandaracinaceae bacterium]